MKYYVTMSNDVLRKGTVLYTTTSKKLALEKVKEAEEILGNNNPELTFEVFEDGMKARIY